MMLEQIRAWIPEKEWIKRTIFKMHSFWGKEKGKSKRKELTGSLVVKRMEGANVGLFKTKENYEIGRLSTYAQATNRTEH